MILVTQTITAHTIHYVSRKVDGFMIPKDITLMPAVRDSFLVPELISHQGKKAELRFIEFFTANIRNKNTRLAYSRAVSAFLHWCEKKKLQLTSIHPIHVAAYIEQHEGSPQTRKQHLAAIRMLFDFLVTGHIIETNPAYSVRGPKYVIKKGKTPVLTAKQTRKLLESIDTSTIIGLRDRAIISTMVYSFGRISAVLGMNIADYYMNGKKGFLRLHEKGGKFHEVVAHHKLIEYLDDYIRAAGIADEKKNPLFRTCTPNGKTLNRNRLHRNEALTMIKRRCKEIKLPETISCHSFRATGITTYLQNGGTVEKAQQIAAHESPRTTKLYDRTNDEISLDEIEKIII